MFLQEKLAQLSDDINSLDEALTNVQRIKRARTMKRKAPVLTRKRKIAMRKPLTQDRVKKRSKLRAKNAVIRKITKGRNKSDLSFAERQRVERRLKKKKNMIDRLSRKMAKDIRSEK